MNLGIRTALYVALAMTVLAESFAPLGLAPSPHEQLFALFAPPFNAYSISTLAFHFWVLRFCYRPSAGEGMAALGLTGLFLAACALSGVGQGLPIWYLGAIPAGALGLASLALLLHKRVSGVPEQEFAHGKLLAACGLVVLMHLNVECWLALTAALHPATFDGAAFIFDSALGFQASVWLAQRFAEWPILATPSSLAYFSVAYGFSALYGLQLAAPERARANIITFIILCWSSAYLLYHFCPVAGPKYAFGADFPGSLPDSGETVRTTFMVPPAPRNAVPSMHFGWALGIFISALSFSRPVRIVFGVLLALNALATLGLGEHYLVDLVIAFPYIVAMYALCLRPGAAAPKAIRNGVVFGLGSTIAWMAVLRAGARFMDTHHALAMLAVVVTLMGGWSFLAPLLQARGAAVAAPVPAPAQRAAGTGLPGKSVIVLFVLSGFAALVYQVLFSKMLSHTFGSAATATYTVLATYMGGMALGSWLGGRIAERRADPVRVYAWCEFAIALYCLATPLIFAAIHSLYLRLAAAFRPDDIVLVWVQMLLGVSALLAPTVLMGMTLPVLVRHVRGHAFAIGMPVAVLYSANTLGAAFGALLSGYALIPAFGLTNTVRLAAWLNLLVAGAAIVICKRLLPPVRGEFAAVAPESAPSEPRARRAGFLALGILGLSGVVSLGLEVVSIHLLAIVAGNSVYAFSLMLFAFLIGLAAGAESARRLLRRALQPELIVSLAQFGLALAVLGGVFVWEPIPAYFATFDGYPLTRGFAARETVRALVCVVAMFPPAFFIGLYYPACLQIAGEAFARGRLRAAGSAIALNTLGNIAGVLLVGFALLPATGALRSIQVLALVSFALGWVLFPYLSPGGRRAVAAAGCAVMAVLLAQPRDFDYNRLATGANVYFRAIDFGPVIDHAESLDGGLTTVHRARIQGRAEPIKTLLTNAKFQGTDDRYGEMISQTAYALTPLMHAAGRDAALLIGFGTGATAGVLHDAGFARLDLVDLSRDVFILSNRHFAGVNHGVTGKPGVETFVTDGRNFLALTDRQYDLISMQLSSIWFAGAAALYNHEFYRLVRARLRPDGVFKQWVQLHHITPVELGYILGTVRAEFRYVWLYLIQEQGIIVATSDPAARPDERRLRLIEENANLRQTLQAYFSGAASLLESLLLAPEAVDRLLGDFAGGGVLPVSTDDNAILEYRTPKGNVLDTDRSYEFNTRWLSGYRIPASEPRTGSR